MPECCCPRALPNRRHARPCRPCRILRPCRSCRAGFTGAAAPARRAAAPDRVRGRPAAAAALRQLHAARRAGPCAHGPGSAAPRQRPGMRLARKLHLLPGVRPRAANSAQSAKVQPDARALRHRAALSDGQRTHRLECKYRRGFGYRRWRRLPDLAQGRNLLLRPGAHWPGTATPAHAHPGLCARLPARAGAAPHALLPAVHRA